MARKVNKKMMEDDCDDCNCHRKWHDNGMGGMFYFLGFVGSAVYYISIATGFWNGVLGVLKALVWPAFLVYEALKFIGA